MLLRATLVSVIFFSLLAAVLFVSAGTPDVPAFWVYIVETALLSTVTLVLVNRRSPDLIAERMHPGEGEQDKVYIKAAVLLSLAHYVIAGLDVGRYHWSVVPLWLRIAGFIAFAAGFGVITWSMLANRYFSSAVRIQHDRGQQVITSGPYRFVRHPGYAGGILYLLSSGLALGSWFSIIPMAAAVVLVTRRTLLEDRMLHDQLDGYADYASRVTHRIVPGLW